MRCKALRALRGITTGKLLVLSRINQLVQSVNEESFWLGGAPSRKKHIKKHYISLLSVHFSALAIAQ